METVHLNLAEMLPKRYVSKRLSRWEYLIWPQRRIAPRPTKRYNPIDHDVQHRNATQRAFRDAEFIAPILREFLYGWEEFAF
eukprot:5853652-Pyramimonas_sp.AAC.1